MESRSAMPLHGRGRNKNVQRGRGVIGMKAVDWGTIEQGSLNGTHFCKSTIYKSMYMANLRNFPKITKQCLGWLYNIPCRRYIYLDLVDFRWYITR